MFCLASANKESQYQQRHSSKKWSKKWVFKVFFFSLSLSSVFTKSYLFPDSLCQSLKCMADFSMRWVLDQWTGLFLWFKDFRTSSSTRALSFKESGNSLQCSCLENPRDGRAWWAAVHGVAESRTRLSNFTFTFHFHALEKEMATHSSVLAWTIPGTGEPGGLPSMGSHRVGHDWSDLAAAAAAEEI